MITRHRKSENSRRVRSSFANAAPIKRSAQYAGWETADSAGAVSLAATEKEDSAHSNLIRRKLLVDLANLRDKSALEWFWGKWHGRVMSEAADDVLELQGELQTIWRWTEWTEYPSISMTVSAPRKVLYKWRSRERFMPLSPDQILDRWLIWRPSLERLKAWQREGWIVPEFRTSFGYLLFVCSVKSRQLVPQYGALRAMLIVGVFEHWDHFRYCENPTCASPYFIANRKDQTVCDAEICKAEKQREHARKWWNENRAKKSQSQAVSKTTKKGRKKNVTPKAR
jgi:hypothetical protein